MSHKPSFGKVRGKSCHPDWDLPTLTLPPQPRILHPEATAACFPSFLTDLPLRQGTALHRWGGDLQRAHPVGRGPSPEGWLHCDPQPGLQRQRHFHLWRQKPTGHSGQGLSGHALCLWKRCDRRWDGSMGGGSQRGSGPAERLGRAAKCPG